MQIISVSLALNEFLLASMPNSDALQISLCVMYACVIEFSICALHVNYSKKLLHKISWLFIYKIIYGRRDIVRRLGCKIYAVDALGGQLEH